MKNIKISVLLFLLTISVFCFVLLFQVPKMVSSRLASPPDLQSAENVLLLRSNKAIAVAKRMLKDYEQNGANGVFASLASNRYNEVAEDGLSFFLFESKELKFWTESTDISMVERDKRAKLVFVQKAWSIALWVVEGEKEVLALVNLKYNYPLQNKFLENSYHPSLNFLEGYSISPIYEQGAFPLTVFGGSPLLYFSHIPKNFDKECTHTQGYLAWISYISALVALFVLFWLPFFRRKGIVSVALLLVIVAVTRVAALYWQVIPSPMWPIFGPEVFAHSWLFPSLFDFFVNSVLVFVLAWYTFGAMPRFLTFKAAYANIALSFFLGLLSFLIFFYSDKLFSSLVLNSTVNLETHRIFNLSIYSLIEYLSISLWFAAAVIISYEALRTLWRVKPLVVFISYTLALVVALVTSYFTETTPSVFGIAIAILVIGGIGFITRGKRKISKQVFTVLAAIFSVYSVLLVSSFAEQKDSSVRKVMAVNLGNERDPVAEVMFPALAKNLQIDKRIYHLLDSISVSLPNLYAHLEDNYLNGYFKKYDFQVTVCLPASELIVEKSENTVNCYSFFEEMLNEFGFRIPGSNFYHLNNQNGRISYLGIMEYVLDNGQEMTLYLELDTKLSRELLGYPELLLEGKVSSREPFGDYSTAKYSQGHLIARTGSFNYPLRNSFPIDSTSRYSTVDELKYSHLVYRSDGDIDIVVSRPKVGLFNITASFAWVFLFFYTSLLLWFRLARVPISKASPSANFRNRIRRAMVEVLLLSLIVVGIVTILYNVKSFEKKNNDNLSEKLLSVMVDVEKNLVSENWVQPEYKDYLTYYLVYLSNVFYTDINLYDTTGVLLASSRPEIIERNLLGSRINPRAWHELYTNNQSRLVQTESIGKMEYISAYVPLAADGRRAVAYLNLPYFTRQGEFAREVFDVLVALINIYALLILFTLGVALFISNQITRPLELIRSKIRKIEIGRHNEPIQYHENDEVGLLVKEYNRMVAELAESAEKLAMSQRQSAWREMAKQIAHEIKNPLTPMKLTIQHLIKAKKENQPDWEQLFDKFSGSFIQQINTLSTIATEFSNFAKMPTSKPEHLSILNLLEESVNLFSSYPNTQISLSSQASSTLIVNADKEQLQRVFVNLLKNSIQAIPRGEKGLIAIALTLFKNKALVKVTDNGVGMPEHVQKKLFSPNFTTKSGGMGLGLAMSKEIIENMGGKIWFETKPNEGASFFVELPVVD